MVFNVNALKNSWNKLGDKRNSKFNLSDFSLLNDNSYKSENDSNICLTRKLIKNVTTIREKMIDKLLKSKQLLINLLNITDDHELIEIILDKVDGQTKRKLYDYMKSLNLEFFEEKLLNDNTNETVVRIDISRITNKREMDDLLVYLENVKLKLERMEVKKKISGHKDVSTLVSFSEQSSEISNINKCFTMTLNTNSEIEISSDETKSQQMKQIFVLPTENDKSATKFEQVTESVNLPEIDITGSNSIVINQYELVQVNTDLKRHSDINLSELNTNEISTKSISSYTTEIIQNKQLTDKKINEQSSKLSFEILMNNDDGKPHNNYYSRAISNEKKTNKCFQFFNCQRKSKLIKINPKMIESELETHRTELSEMKLLIIKCLKLLEKTCGQ